MEGVDNSTQQKTLVRVIQNVHEELRYKCQKDPDAYLDVWKKHCSDPVRLEYASAMHTLATQVWASKSHGGNRIEVIKAIIADYFMGGGSQKVIRRMLRKYSPNSEHLEKQLVKVSLPERRPRVLDVGSCYNPFANFDFEVTPIDLSPATPEVFQCDFLNVPFGDDIEILEGCVRCLPSSYFHAVIFCLLLEYLPDTRLRLTAVHRAYRALRDNGILIVVTPDSKHQQKNMKMIQSWQKAFMQLGFDRISYAKHDHLHCLAFRKLCEISRRIMGVSSCCGHSFEEVCSCCVEKLSPMLFIHQDKHDYVSKFEPESWPERSDGEQLQDAQLFNELPEVVDS